ncbi:MAG: hemolysin family protein [Chloroflexi bacterium]|nr:hemolysin family protein [Chloroflexota bacterium]
MSNLFVKVLLTLVLILINGIFSLAEMALVSVRKSRLQQLADEGDKRAVAALSLIQQPSRFFSTIQIGITLVSILTGALAGADIADALAGVFAQTRYLKSIAGPLAYILVVGLMTFVTIVLGELVPKRIAVNSSEKIALTMASSMRFISAVAKPFVTVLSAATEGVLKLLGIKLHEEPIVTEEEFRVLLEEGTEAGVFEESEQEMVESVLNLGDRRISSLMTPRHDIVWLDTDESIEETKRKILESGFSRFPVARESLDNLLGEVQTRDLLVHSLNSEPFDLQAALTTPLYIPEVMPILSVLEQFKQASTQMALVIDEYGSLVGLVTLQDILEMIVGDMPSAEAGEEPDIVQREDGSWLLDGMVPIEELKELLNIEGMLPGEEQGLFNTLAGFITNYLGRIPATADHFEWANEHFEVVDMDGNRIDRVLVSAVPPEEHTEEPEPPAEAD